MVAILSGKMLADLRIITLKGKNMKTNNKRCAKVKSALIIIFCLLLFGPVRTVAAVEGETTVSSGCTADEIQAALDMNAYGQYDKLTVKIPAGIYNLDTTLYIYSNTTIEAEEGAVFRKMDNHNGKESYGSILENKLENDKGGYGNCHDIAIVGGVWDSTEVMDNSVGTETFRFIHCDNVVVKDAVLCNVPEGSHLLVLAGTSNALIENCEFYGYGVKNSNNHKEAIQLDIVHNSEIVPTAQENVVAWDDLPCKNVTIKNCDFQDFPRAIGSHTGVKGVLHDGIVITGNRINNMSDTAIKLFNYKNTTVENNTITNCIEGVLVYTDMKGLTGKEYMNPLSGTVAALPEDYRIVICNNEFGNMKMSGADWGDAVRIMGSSNIPISGVEVSNNTIESMERFGVYATEARNVVIVANLVSKVSKVGLYATTNCKNVSVVRNHVKNCGGYGIFLGNSLGGQIYGNTVKESGLEDAEQIHAIYVYKCGGTGKENAVHIYKNTVEGNDRAGSQGIKVSTSDYVSVIGNVVRRTKDRGIYIYSSNNAEVTGNQITEAGKKGTGVN